MQALVGIARLSAMVCGQSASVTPYTCSSCNEGHHIHTHYMHATYTLHTYLPTYLPTYLRAYMPTYLRTYIHTYRRRYIHAYIHTYVPTCLHTFIPTYIPTVLHACIHTCIHTDVRIHTYVPAYTNTYMRILPTYSHTCAHTHTHTHPANRRKQRQPVRLELVAGPLAAIGSKSMARKASYFPQAQDLEALNCNRSLTRIEVPLVGVNYGFNGPTHNRLNSTLPPTYCRDPAWCPPRTMGASTSSLPASPPEAEAWMFVAFWNTVLWTEAVRNVAL